MKVEETGQGAAAREIEQASGGTVIEGQPLRETPAVPRKRGPLTRTSVYIDVSIREEIKDYARTRGSRESEVLRAALAIGMNALKRPDTAQGRRETQIDDEIDRVEDAVSDGDYALASKIVRKLQFDDYPLTIRERLVKSLVNRDYLTALHIIDRLSGRTELS